jgi:hypothetical protein
MSATKTPNYKRPKGVPQKVDKALIDRMLSGAVEGYVVWIKSKSGTVTHSSGDLYGAKTNILEHIKFDCDKADK